MADRTRKSILNAQVSLLYYFLQMILGFWSRKVFYDYLGSEVLGLDTTAYSLLNFLNLAELGIGTSVSFFLYKPLFDHDEMKINEIVALQGWIYRRVAAIIIFAAAILMMFFPLIFEKSPLPIGYAYATFGVMLFGTLLGYFVNYRQIVLAADQKTYKVSIATGGASIFFKVMLILLLPVVSFPFILYLSTNLAGAVFGCLWLNRVLKKEYPWLSEKGMKGKELLKKYPEVLKKTSQVFVHRISGFVTMYISPIIMYSFASLTIVAYYGNYLVLTEKITSLMSSVFGSTGAGIGNLIASRDEQRIQSVFWELIDSRLCISWICLFCCLFLIEPFICVWLGQEYLLSKPLLALVVLSSAIFINRPTVDSFISGYGMYKDVWAPVTEAILTVGLSIGLGYVWNIEGVVLGGFISHAIFIGVWKPYFLFTQGFHQSPHLYFLRFAGRCVLLGVAGALLYGVASLLPLERIHSYLTFFLWATPLFFASVVIVGGLFYAFTSGTRAFTSRMTALVVKKFAKQ